MAERLEVHFAGDRGALCGASPPYAWSWKEGGTTCAKCRALLEARERERVKRQSAVALANVLAGK